MVSCVKEDGINKEKTKNEPELFAQYLLFAQPCIWYEMFRVTAHAAKIWLGVVFQVVPLIATRALVKKAL